MKTIPIDDRMSQVAERADREHAEKFRQESLARLKQERAQQRQRDIEASADVPRQTVESPT